MEKRSRGALGAGRPAEPRLVLPRLHDADRVHLSRPLWEPYTRWCSRSLGPCCVSSASRILSSLLPTPLRPVRHTHQDHRDRETWAWTPTPFHVGSPRQPLPAASPRSLNLTARRGLTPSALLSSPGGLSHPQTALRRPFSLLPSVLSGPSSPAQPRDFDFQVW